LDALAGNIRVLYSVFQFRYISLFGYIDNTKNMQIKAELLFPSKLKDEPLICNICKQFDIVLNILEASFSTDTGWAILIFEGDEAEVNRTLEYLKNKNVEIKDIHKGKE